MRLFRGKNRVHKITKRTNHFQHHRWQLIHLLEEYSGVWPYQNKFARCSLQTFHHLTFGITMFAVQNHIAESLKISDYEMAMEGIVWFFFALGLAVKAAVSSAMKSQRLQIYEEIWKHFDSMTDPEEAEILDEYANKGFNIIAMYVGSLFVSCTLFFCIPNIDYFLTCSSICEEHKFTLPFPMNYGIDHAENWPFIGFHFISFVYCGFLINITFDLSFIFQGHHIQGLFKIVKRRVNKASELAVKRKGEAIKNNSADVSYSMVSSAIDLHTECYEMVKMMESHYTHIWGGLLLMSCVCIGATIHMIAARRNDPMEAIKVLCGFMALLIHFVVVFSQGQSIIDSNSMIIDACYDCEWYNLPVKLRKLLILMMKRSTVRCELTGTKFFHLSLEMFSKMLIAGIEYYTVFEQSKKA